jgi:biopolymer transport protein ExbB
MSMTAHWIALLVVVLIGGALDATPIGPPSAHAQATTAISPAAPPPAPALHETNPYGLESLWKQGDFITHGTLIFLLIMSMGSWYIAITKSVEHYRVMREAQAANATFWTADSIRTGIQGLPDRSPFRFIAESAVQATETHERLLDRIDLHTWVTMAIQQSVETVQTRLQGGLTFLATVGSTAPFIGLFGTVWGIYHALTAIGAAGQASIDKVAGPVGEALIMTAFGLAVAVPAVLAYNWLVRRNKLVMEKVRTFSANLHSMLMSGARDAATLR